MKKTTLFLTLALFALTGCNFPGLGGPAPLPPVPTAAPLPTLTPGPSPAPEWLDCGEDVDCLIQAAQECRKGGGLFPMTIDFFGAVSDTVMAFEFLGPDFEGMCRFTVSTQSVSLSYSEELRQQLLSNGLTEEQIEEQRAQAEKAALEQGVNGECRGAAEDIAALLRQWQEGRFTSKDWDPFACSGGSFGDAGGETTIESTVIVETPSAGDVSALPALVMEFSRTEEVYDGETLTGRRYYLSVTNWADFPEALFETASDLPPCGKNPNASRSWLTFYDADTERALHGFCGLKQPERMSELWFFVAEDTSPPRAVYLELWDRRENVRIRSNAVPIP